MKYELKKTDKEYTVIVNYPALQKRAEELGYQSVRLIQFEKLTDIIVEELKREYEQQKLQVLLFLYQTDSTDERDLIEKIRIAETGLNYFCNFFCLKNEKRAGIKRKISRFLP